MTLPVPFTADDFGYADAVDAGIAGLVERGRVSGTSCLTASPRWRGPAAALARTLRPRADLGLHLDLTEFDRLAPLPRLYAGARLGLVGESPVRERLRRQLGAFEDALGTPPDYVDGHQHVHQLPVVARVLVEELCARYAGGSRPWVRLSLPATLDLKGRLIAWTGAAGLRRRLDRAGIRHSRRLLGVYDFRASPPYLERLAGWCAEARAGDALMTHPARAVVPGDPLGAARAREFEALASPAAGELLEAHGIRPARGDCLAEPAP